MFERISTHFYQVSLALAMACMLLLLVNADWFFAPLTLYFVVVAAAYRFLR